MLTRSECGGRSPLPGGELEEGGSGGSHTHPPPALGPILLCLSLRRLCAFLSCVLFSNIYLFIYLAVPGLTCGTWDLCCNNEGSSSCGMQALSCSTWDLVP